ncbi:DUF6456 domain-containing protein [Paenirhodobacter populi]|uniref:DUF6456 domain-containing protein n=1 Tax=Paenirhodobacter populi TaxID=2306993 RepID=UPI000FE2D251|nr:DUF6456 domain-containing protein [Sinirhodobacter populi]RWR09729.1 hypothetical protein D2T32_05130 [Sinirhodobacter populi]
MKLAIAPLGLNFYLRHVVYGEEQREIARRSGVAASNVCRHVQRVEGLREDDASPEWREILDALEAHLVAGFEAFPSSGVTVDMLLAALGETPEGMRAAFSEASAPAARAGAVIVSSAGMPYAAVMHHGKPAGRVPRPAVLAAVAVGFVRPVGTKGRVRTFTVDRAAVRAGGAEPPSALVDPTGGEAPGVRGRNVAPEEPPINRIHRKNPELVGREDLRTAQEFGLLWGMREAEMSSFYDRLRKTLAPRLFRILELVCGERVGLEVAEAEMGLPARSGKVLLSVALETARHSGVLR